MAATARQGNQNPQTPFFGCKISLISKSEIRYEGILYTIDPQESTIALAKVRSFGSEDRPVERPVPPRDDVFEFIIFRASDIKDLIVDDPPPQSQPQLQDPAIIQVNNQSTSFPSSFPQGSISHAVPTGPAPVVSAPVAQVPKPTPQLQHPQPTQQQKAAKPQPSSQQAGGDTQTDAPTVKLTKPTASNVAGAQGYAKVAGGGVLPQQQKQPAQRQQPQPQSSVPFNQTRQQKQPGEQQASAPGTGPLNQRPTRPGQQQPPNLGQNGFMNRRGPQDQNAPQNRVLGEGQNPNFQARNGGPGAHQQQGFRPYNQRFQRGGFHQGGPQQYGGFRRGGPGGFNGPRTFNTRQPGTGLSAHPNGPKFPPLPDGDFDFEKAQADFKILEEKLNALKLNGAVGDGGDGADSSEVLVPGIPVSAISVAALEQEDVSAEPCYNKTKSFFDAISCEALEREKGSMNRVDWKQERKLNRETFGVVSARRPTFFRVNNRGGGFGGGYHNHRGGYQNRGPGGYSQNRYQQNRGPRPTSNSSNGNNVSSTTNGGAPGAQRTPAKASPGASNGVAASPAPIAAKN